MSTETTSTALVVSSPAGVPVLREEPKPLTKAEVSERLYQSVKRFTDLKPDFARCFTAWREERRVSLRTMAGEILLIGRILPSVQLDGNVIDVQWKHRVLLGQIARRLWRHDSRLKNQNKLVQQAAKLTQWDATNQP